MPRKSSRRIRQRLAACLAVAIACGPGPAFAAPDATDQVIEVIRIDGSATMGTWMGMDVDKRLLRVGGGELAQAIPFSEIAALHFTRENRAEAAREPLTVMLGDGSRLQARLLEDRDPVDEVLLLRTDWAQRLELKLDQIAALRLATPADQPQAEALFDKALADRRAAQDILVTRRLADADPRVLRGALIDLAPDGGRFVFNGRQRTFGLDKVFGIVLAKAGTAAEQRGLTLELADGSSLRADPIASEAATLRVRTSLKAELPLDVADIVSIRFHSNRLAYLSDLTPASMRVEGRLHAAWEVQPDRGVMGGPLAIGGRRFDRGLGVHSYTALTYDLEEPFEAFAATVGVDDRVRPRGSVTFAVEADGREVWTSGLLTGEDKPVDVLLPLDGVRQLILIVDYGDDLDLWDQAIWGGARLIRPAAGPSD